MGSRFQIFFLDSELNLETYGRIKIGLKECKIDIPRDIFLGKKVNIRTVLAGAHLHIWGAGHIWEGVKREGEGEEFHMVNRVRGKGGCKMGNFTSCVLCHVFIEKCVFVCVFCVCV